MIKTMTTNDLLLRGSDSTSPTFCDIESDGLYVNCSLIQLKQNDTQLLVRTNSDEEVELVKAKIQPLHLVFWNSVYDLGTLNMVPEKLDDLWIAFKIAYPQLPEFTLDKAVAFLKYHHLYEGLDKKALQKQGFVRKAYLSQDQLRYAAADVEALSLMWNDKKIQRVIQNSLAYRLAIYSIRESIVWQQNGIPVLLPQVHLYKQKALTIVEELTGQLEDLTVPGFNARSSKQVKDLLGIGSSDKATLTRIALEGMLDEAKEYAAKVRVKARSEQNFTATEQTIAELIMRVRKAKNDLSNLAKYSYPIVYGRFSPVGARTSRWSCKGSKDIPNFTNLQNYSRDFKACFGVTKESGLIIVAADFATLEIRIAAAIMKEPNMHQALLRGEDIHKTTASLIFGKPLKDITGKERSNAKVANFGLTYGMGRETFKHYAYDMYGIKFTDDEAKELIGKFFKAYPGLKAYHNMVGAGLRKHNYICQTALGYRMKPQQYAEAINGPTQGTGGEVGRLTIHLMVKKDPEVLKYLVNFIHDAFYLIVPESDKDYWGKILADSMQEAWVEICKSNVFHYHDIPMGVDLMSGYHMGDLEEDFAGGGQALSLEEMRAAKERNIHA